MRIPRSPLRLLAVTSVSVLVLVAAGCGDGGHKKAGPEASGAAARKSSASDNALKKLVQTTTAGVRADTGHAAIEMRFSVAPDPQPGQPFRVTVSVLPSESAPTLTVSVPPSEGLKLEPVTAQLTFDKVEPGAIYTIPLDYTAANAGVQIVTVTATEASPTGSDSATYSFPVVVGAKSLAPPPVTTAPVAPPGAAAAPAAKPKS